MSKEKTNEGINEGIIVPTLTKQINEEGCGECGEEKGKEKTLAKNDEIKKMLDDVMQEYKKQGNIDNMKKTLDEFRTEFKSSIENVDEFTKEIEEKIKNQENKKKAKEKANKIFNNFLSEIDNYNNAEKIEELKNLKKSDKFQNLDSVTRFMLFGYIVDKIETLYRKIFLDSENRVMTFNAERYPLNMTNEYGDKMQFEKGENLNEMISEYPLLDNERKVIGKVVAKYSVRDGQKVGTKIEQELTPIQVAHYDVSGSLLRTFKYEFKKPKEGDGAEGDYMYKITRQDATGDKYEEIDSHKIQDGKYYPTGDSFSKNGVVTESRVFNWDNNGDLKSMRHTNPKDGWGTEFFDKETLLEQRDGNNVKLVENFFDENGQIIETREFFNKKYNDVKGEAFGKVKGRIMRGVRDTEYQKKLKEQAHSTLKNNVKEDNKVYETAMEYLEKNKTIVIPAEHIPKEIKDKYIPKGSIDGQIITFFDSKGNLCEIDQAEIDYAKIPSVNGIKDTQGLDNDFWFLKELKEQNYIDFSIEDDEDDEMNRSIEQLKERYQRRQAK